MPTRRKSPRPRATLKIYISDKQFLHGQLAEILTSLLRKTKGKNLQTSQVSDMLDFLFQIIIQVNFK